MSRVAQWFGLSAGLLVTFMFAVGCETVSHVGATIGEATGVLTPDEADSIRRTYKDLTPEQEYFIGRSVSATILESYSVWDQPAATEYINLLGQALALVSDRPETFGGYRFLILDSDEINAFAAPGGYIFVSRGMLALCASEDELAAVLAHEIGHVQHQHGLQSIRTARITSAFSIGAFAAARTLGSQDVRQLTEIFGGTIEDVTRTLTTSGYSRRAEREADAAAVAILKRVGYDPHALIRMLRHMDERLEPGGRDFARTHPPPQERIRDIQRMVRSVPQPDIPAARQTRFEQAMQGI